ncbi:MAG TPA: hypothetical protein VM118_12990 [Acidobacteriota bacterium]|nr:hypothetical protein [Acidobacteriota bacterium]
MRQRSINLTWLTAIVLTALMLAGCSKERSSGPTDDPPPTPPAPLITESPIAAISDTLYGETPKGGDYPYEYTVHIPSAVLTEIGPIDDILVHIDGGEISVLDITRSEWTPLVYVPSPFTGAVRSSACCTWLLSESGMAVEDVLDDENGTILLSTSGIEPPSIQLLRYREDYRPTALGSTRTCEPRALAVIDGNIWVSVRDYYQMMVWDWGYRWKWFSTDSLHAFNVAGERIPVTLPRITPVHAMTQCEGSVWTLTEPYPTIVQTDVFGQPSGSFVIEREGMGDDWEVRIAPSTLFWADQRLWVLEWRRTPEWSATLLGIVPDASLSSGRAVIDTELRLPPEVNRPTAVVKDGPFYYVHNYNSDEDVYEIARVDEEGRLRDVYRPGVASAGIMAWDGEAVWLIHTVPIATRNPTLRLSRFYIP